MNGGAWCRPTWRGDVWVMEADPELAGVRRDQLELNPEGFHEAVRAAPEGPAPSPP